MELEPIYQVVRTRITPDWATPNQVLEIETVHNRAVAEALHDILSRKPEVRAGKEVVRIVER